MKRDTLIVHSGRHPEDQFGAVNPPVYHASTITFRSVADLERTAKTPFDGVRYGRFGTPTVFAFEEAVAALEGGWRTVATSSGLGAIAGALTAFLSAGDHLLMVDSTYFPSRKFCDTILARFGIETTYYDPLIGAGITALMRPNTKVVFVESPGSLTFEVQDVPAIATAAHAGGAIVMMDNTWGTPLFFRPFEKGVDVSIQAATKYIVGHADAMLGTITTTEEHWLRVKTAVAAFGYSAGSDEAYLGLRGLRTLSARLSRHQESTLKITQWLETRPEVLRVLYPALPSDPGHELWRRDFLGACGLFGLILQPGPKAAVEAMLDGLNYFGLGYSWGGFESLAIPSLPNAVVRTATRWEPAGNMIRLHIGLEDAEDLMTDLEDGLKSYKAKL